jgi:hypothetical protein
VNSEPPNPRVQRTRPCASLRGSPLTRHPLGAPGLGIALVLVFACSPPAANPRSAAETSFLPGTDPNDVCPLHHQGVVPVEVPLVGDTTGLTPSLEKYERQRSAAAAVAFPYAGPRSIDGSCSQTGSTTQTRYVCASCVKAQQEWEAKHPKPAA